MKHILYRCNVLFENYCQINGKLFHYHFNYLKFHTVTHFVKCICNYGSTVNYNRAHNKAAYKYFSKLLYTLTNKKKCKLQILKYNIHKINVITIKNTMQMSKLLDKSAKQNSLLLRRLM